MPVDFESLVRSQNTFRSPDSSAFDSHTGSEDQD